MSERKCADCGTDISSRHYNAKLCLDCYYKRNNYNSSMKKQIAAFETRNAQEIAKLRLQLDQAKAFAGRQTLRLATMTEKRDRLELLRRTHGAAADAMAIARDEAQAEAIRLRSALANIVQAAAESKPLCSTHASIPNAFIDAGSDVLSARCLALQYSISDLEVENRELRDKVERLCTLFREEMHRDFSEADITDILERCMAGERM